MAEAYGIQANRLLHKELPVIGITRCWTVLAIPTSQHPEKVRQTMHTTGTATRRLMLAAVLVAAIPHVAGAQRVAGPNPSGPVPAPVNLDTTGLFAIKFVKIGDDLFMGGQPTERALREMRAQGVTTVVNLRVPEEMTRVQFDESALVRELGMKYVHIPLRGTAAYPYTPGALAEFAAAMSAADGKVLLHCASTARTSQLWAAYLIQERGMPAATVIEQMRNVDLMTAVGRTGEKQAVEQFLGREVPELRRRPLNPSVPPVAPQGHPALRDGRQVRREEGPPADEPQTGLRLVK